MLNYSEHLPQAKCRYNCNPEAGDFQNRLHPGKTNMNFGFVRPVRSSISISNHLLTFVDCHMKHICPPGAGYIRNVQTEFSTGQWYFSTAAERYKK